MDTNSVYLITGGTGSFGNTVVRRLLRLGVRKIRVFSRDEKKQSQMRDELNTDRVSFVIGDVRDFDSIKRSMTGVDFVFHAAALKQVPSCEFFPMEAYKTNVLGTSNTIDSAINAHVKKVICLSTDKAVYPINAMGISKAMMEKVAISKTLLDEAGETKICVTRYGNVMASRGSVIPLFVRQILNDQPITITDEEMTRFMMSLNDAVDLVFYAFKNGISGDRFVQKAPGSTIAILVKALIELFDKPEHPIQILGTRHGEKKHETLLSREEMAVAEDLGEYFRVPPDSRDLNYTKYFVEGETNVSKLEDYTSENTKRLDTEEMKKLLMSLPFIKSALKGRILDEEV